MKIDTKKLLRYVGAAIIYVVLAVLFYLGWQHGIIQKFIKEAGIWAPIFYIIFASFKAVFPIIPGEVLVVLGVILFGPVWGLTYAVIGLSLGSTTAFFLARRYGRPFVEWLMGPERYSKVEKLSGDKTLFTFLLIYLLPGTPDDFVTYIAGLTSVSFFTFLPICVLGRLPSYLIYTVGGVSLRDLNFRALFFWWGVMFVLAGGLYLAKIKLFDKIISRRKAK